MQHVGGYEHCIQKFWSKNLKGRDHSEDLGVDGRILLEVFMEMVWEVVDWLHMTQSRGPVAGCFEHGNEPSGCIKRGEFVDYLSDY
jgi:hypothetical protein